MIRQDGLIRQDLAQTGPTPHNPGCAAPSNAEQQNN